MVWEWILFLSSGSSPEISSIIFTSKDPMGRLGGQEFRELRYAPDRLLRIGDFLVTLS